MFSRSECEPNVSLTYITLCSQNCWDVFFSGRFPKARVNNWTAFLWYHSNLVLFGLQMWFDTFFSCLGRVWSFHWKTSMNNQVILHTFNMEHLNECIKEWTTWSYLYSKVNPKPSTRHGFYGPHLLAVCLEKLMPRDGLYALVWRRLNPHKV